ncbi:MAG: preprotein translocase subunit SecE [Clostridia bacterium]|nr:preprotein translocase subunit SecE [Clostridia bacterium]
MAAQQKAKKPNVFKRLGGFFVKSWSELKKVSWPSFKTVLKNTGIVLLVVLFFALIIFGSDTLFAWLLSLISTAPAA